MSKKSNQDALMIRYLLGSATEEEQAHLEERFFADDELYLQLEALQDELKYEYAQGGLTAEERRSFESRFLVSFADRQGVTTAKAVLDRAYEVRKDAVALGQAPAPVATGWWQSWSRALTAQRWAFASGVLALAVVSGGSWFMLQTMQLRDEVRQLEAQRNQARQQVADGRSEANKLNEELANARSHQPQGKQQAEPGPAALFSFVLLPGLVRGAEGPKRLVIPSSAAEVMLNLEVKPKSDYPRYRAELQNLDGDVLWSQNVPATTLRIPRQLLQPGDYVAILKGVSASGELVDAGEYYFQIVKK